MKTPTNTVSIVITIPVKQYYRKFKDISKYKLKDYQYSIEINMAQKTREYTSEEFKSIADIRSAAFKLGLMEKTRVPQVIVRRTALVYLLKQKYSGPIIARALECSVTNISHTLKRYENLKRYRDYQEAVLEISQHLKQCSLVDCSPETL
jgi:hypothetical protein